MHLLERDADVITGSTNLEDLHCLPNFPVFMGAVEHDPEDDLVADMSWSISRHSGLIQLKRLLPLDVLYQAQTTTSAVGALWMAHHKAFAEFIHAYAPASVLELGGAHGILSTEYHKLSDIPWTILEPNPSPADGCKARFIRGFFDNNFAHDEPFDTIIHSHVFEHLYQPDLFAEHLSKFLADNTRMIFSLPHLSAWLRNKYTNCINFEHTVFLTEPYVEYLLSKHGFRLIAKKYFMNGHSIFYAAEKDSSVKPIDLPNGLYIENKKLYREFVNYYDELIFDLNAQMRDATTPIYLFGAHVFAQYLIAFGLNTDKVVSLLDNDPRKQGKRLYGTRLMIQSPKILRGALDPVVILKAGIYNEEIKLDIRENINDSTIFLE